MNDHPLMLLQNLLEVRAEQLPQELVELEVGGCKEVRLLPGSLSHQKNLKKVRAVGVGTFTVRRHAYLNSSANNSLLQVRFCLLMTQFSPPLISD